MELDGITKIPDCFSCPIGSKVGGCVSDWPVVKFKNIPNPHFPELPQCVVEDLSTDQKFAYQVYTSVVIGLIEPDLQYFEVKLIVQSRCLTLACRISLFYVSQSQPSNNGKYLAQFAWKYIFHPGLK